MIPRRLVLKKARASWNFRVILLTQIIHFAGSVWPHALELPRTRYYEERVVTAATEVNAYLDLYYNALFGYSLMNAYFEM
jgi:hypothetical protein